MLITNDVYIKVQDTLRDVLNDGFSIKATYNGVYYWTVDLENENDKFALNDVYEKNKSPINLIENQYLIIKDKATDEVIEVYKMSDGSLKKVGYGKIENDFVKPLTPKNPEQRCLFDALKNKNVSIIYAGGKFGTGYLNSSLI